MNSLLTATDTNLAGGDGDESPRNGPLDEGIQEFWLFDRFKRQLTNFHRRGGMDQEQFVPWTESCTTLILPGIELPVGQILSRAEDWSQSL
jgi:Uma2 family endonuclease